MKYGIYKPGKQIYFFKNEEDHASWSVEITNVIKILADHGDDVYILTPTDLENGELPNVHVMKNGQDMIKLDRVFMYCGLFDDNSNDLIQDIKDFYQCPVDLILTDLKLAPKDISLFSRVLINSKRMLTVEASTTYELNDKDIFETTKKISTYLPIYGALLVGANNNFNLRPANKDIRYYFGGTERDRLADFLEYVWRPDCLWHGKSAFLNTINYIPYDAHLDLMKRTKYSIMIGDKNYNAVGVTSSRYYECLANGIITFADSKYDPDCLYMSKDDFRRVENYADLYNKMKILDSNEQLYLSILKRQYNEITDSKIKGEEIYKILTAK
jgi:hypothetical protein